MVKHTLKILQQMLQDFESVSDHFGTSCIKGLTCIITITIALTNKIENKNEYENNSDN